MKVSAELVQVTWEMFGGLDTLVRSCSGGEMFVAASDTRVVSFS